MAVKRGFSLRSTMWSMWLRFLALGALMAAACGGSSDVASGADAAVIDAPPGAIDASGGGDGSRDIDGGRMGIDAGMRDGGGVITSDGGIGPGGGDGGAVRDCTPSGTCSSGPMCGTRCCPSEEWCDTTDNTC